MVALVSVSKPPPLPSTTSLTFFILHDLGRYIVLHLGREYSSFFEYESLSKISIEGTFVAFSFLYFLMLHFSTCYIKVSFLCYTFISKLSRDGPYSFNVLRIYCWICSFIITFLYVVVSIINKDMCGWGMTKTPFPLIYVQVTYLTKIANYWFHKITEISFLY